MVVFSEDHNSETCRRGRIEVICGSMFSGKTEELIRRLRRATFAKQRVEIFKPAIDTRYSDEEVVSHDRSHRLVGQHLAVQFGNRRSWNRRSAILRRKHSTGL